MWEHIGEPRKVDRLTASRRDVTETPHSHSGPDRGRRVTWAGGLLVIVAPASRLRPHHKVGREGEATRPRWEPVSYSRSRDDTPPRPGPVTMISARGVGYPRASEPRLARARGRSRRSGRAPPDQAPPRSSRRRGVGYPRASPASRTRACAKDVRGGTGGRPATGPAHRDGGGWVRSARRGRAYVRGDWRPCVGRLLDGACAGS